MTFLPPNIFDCLRHFSETLPEQPAMEDGGRVIRYRELDLRTDDAAVNICAAGILAGDIGKDLFHLIGIDEQEKLARRFGSNRPSFALKAHHKMRQIVRDNEIVLSPRILICSENLSLAG